MKKFLIAIRKYWLLILAGIIFWLVFVIYRPFEPHYHWKALSVWTAIYSDPTWISSDNMDYKMEQKYLAADAIQHIGTRALPYAIKLCRAKNSPLDKKLLGWVDEGHKLLGIHLVFAREAHSRSHQLFDALGPIAKPAIPDLIELLQDKDGDVVGTAAVNLMCIGPDAIAPLIEVLTNQNALARGYAAEILGSLGHPSGNGELQIRPSIPVLIRCLNDEDKFVRYRAALALEIIQQDVPTVVQALIEALKRQPEGSSWFVSDALGSFKTNAQSAVPLLIDIMKSGQWNDAGHALYAIRNITPEIAQPYIDKFNVALTNPPPDASVSNLFYNYHGLGIPAKITDRMLPATPASANW